MPLARLPSEYAITASPRALVARSTVWSTCGPVPTITSAPAAIRRAASERCSASARITKSVLQCTATTTTSAPARADASARSMRSHLATCATWALGRSRACWLSEVVHATQATRTPPRSITRGAAASSSLAPAPTRASDAASSAARVRDKPAFPWS